jgi:hypothetical protein
LWQSAQVISNIRMYEVQITDDELGRLKSLRGPNRTIALVRAWQCCASKA